MNKILITFLIIFSASISYSQNSKTLEDFGIDKYYSIEETKENIFSNIKVKATPISNDIINNSYSNIDDLNWLSEIAKNNKVLLVGETHYSRYIGNIISRIFFAINYYDYYSTIFIEKPYSSTEFINYYVTLEDNKMANEFFDSELKKYINTDEEALFYKQIRYWNKKNKSKPLSIGATDLREKKGDGACILVFL